MSLSLASTCSSLKWWGSLLSRDYGFLVKPLLLGEQLLPQILMFSVQGPYRVN